MSRDSHHEGPLPVTWDSIRTALPAHDCFADEIAIDFPSVHPLVERVRDAFLGERPGVDTLTTDILLSRREALTGAIVPLEVPMRGTCPLCGGRGEVWTEPCVSCRGTGDALLHRRIRLTVPPGVADGARFRFRVSSPDAATVRVQVTIKRF